jgi:sugar phosphate isomerase/epimerase
VSGKRRLTRRNLIGAAGAGAAVGALGPLAPRAGAHGGRWPGGGDHDEDYGFGKGGDIPLDRIGIQLFTIRDLFADNELDMPGAFELLADAGYAGFEVGGDYDGRTAAEVRDLAVAAGLKPFGNHFGPRSSGPNTWNDPSVRAQFFADAHTFGFDFVGTGSSYDVQPTVDGYKAMAAQFNVWGEDAVRNGFRYFYFHNHDREFARVDGSPLYDILLQETDPRYVKFELDIGWIEVAGESTYDYLRRWGPSRFPLFHVKDIRWDPNGPRTAAPGTVNAGKKFFFADVGKGVLDWPRIFSALRNPKDHHYFVEHDDAGADETVDATSPKPPNPAGSANTAWTSRKYLANLEIPKRRW